MNQELANVIKIYSTGTHKELSNCLIGKSKDTLIGILVDLLTMYINDKNSSTIREFITVTLAGYTHKEGKIGYNGFRQDAFIPGKTIMCEAKPKNVDTSLRTLRKLNGGGNFTDFTFGRLERYKQEKNLNMLISGFVDGKLVYILELPFNYPEFTNHLESQLQRRFKKKEDITGQFLRSANFDYKHFINCPKLKVIYLLNKNKLEMYKSYIVKNFYEFLVRRAE
ncbi:MAG: hypothetical protein U9R23_08260 [Candidatus Cloacimonadota bacterium]|nr:hypothetical protein [Candidatus Cloacimonadota bacterium]